MARFHFQQHLLNEEGQPIDAADITIYLAGTTTSAYIFTSESGGVAVNSTPQAITNSSGKFEFWIGDLRETNGYNKDQKFKVQWSKTGITTDTLDYVEILHNNSSYTNTNTLSATWNVNHALNSTDLVVQCWVNNRLKTPNIVRRIDNDNITITWISPSAGDVCIIPC